MLSFIKIFKTAWTNFFRNNGFSIATVFILVITLVLVPSVILFHGLTQSLISSIEDKADISVYFNPIASPEEILSIQDQLKDFPEVESIEYVSKEEILVEFTETHKDDERIIEGLEEYGGNPFFDSLNIKAFEASQYEAVVGFLENITNKEIIDHTTYSENKTVIDRIFSITAYVNNIGIGLIVILSIVAVLIVFNQIRLTILNSKEEIKVMKLVGATNWFIRAPFIAQGIIAGVIASIIAIIIFGILAFFLAPKAAFLISSFNIFDYFITNILFIFSLQLLIGIALGTFSSIIAVRKYLEV